MIRAFRRAGTEDLFHGRDSRAARRTCPAELWPVARRKLEYLDSAAALRDLALLPGNRLEALSGIRRGTHSIRINRQYRLCFRWTVRGPTDVEIVDYH
jgi:proteic killer suppression protein